MKKAYLLVLLVLGAVLSSVDTKAQTISNVTLIDSCAGLQSITTISTASANLKLSVDWGDGNSQSVNLQNTQKSVFSYHSYANTGTYTIKYVLYLNNNPIDSTIETYSNYCSFIGIYAYSDNNSNCVQNTGESVIISGLKIEIDSAGTVIDTITLAAGYYHKVKPGTVYKYKLLNAPLGSSATCPSSGLITVTAPSAGNYTQIKFGVQCGSSSQFDLGVAMAAWLRPVNKSYLSVYAFNNSCGTKSGTVTLNISNKYKYDYAYPTPTSVSGNTITWNVSNLSYTNGKYFTVVLDTNSQLTIGDTVCNLLTITPTSGDVNTNNNTISQCDKVRASWDPNDKSVYPSGDIMPGTKLTYSIRFENLGNDTAFNISILDTLSDKLDLSTLEVMHSSHPVAHSLVDGPGAQKVLRFEFKDIRLADKNNPDHNKGFVQFSINAKSNLAPLTQINNRAGIYFDINPVILTNYTENRIAPVSVNSVELDKMVSVYPNPVTDVLTIKTLGTGFSNMKMLNTMGQTVSVQTVTGNTTYVNMKQLPAGIYYIQLTGKNGTVTQKVEKQ